MKYSSLGLLLFISLFFFTSCEKKDPIKELENLEKISTKDGNKEEDNKNEKSCFYFVYPISYTMPDASTVSGNSEEEIEVAIKAWYEANPEVKEKPELQFPVDVLFDEGTTKTISTEEELKAAYEWCK